MIIDNTFEIGEIVYLKTDTDQEPHIVTGIQLKNKQISYILSCGRMSDVYCYDIEIQREKDMLLMLNVDKKQTA